MAEDLTAKQQRFVAEYLIDLNATQAAIRAGYSQPTAYSIGHENLSKPEIAQAIAEAQAERAKRTEVTADRVLKELAKIGFSDIRRVFTPAGELLPPTDMDDDTAACIASVEVVTRRVHGASDGMEEQAHGGALKRAGSEVEYIHKIKAWDKLGALTQIGKHLGMFTDKIEHAGPGGGPIRLATMTDEEIERRIASLSPGQA
jgi:phage terminase small subunit